MSSYEIFVLPHFTLFCKSLSRRHDCNWTLNAMIQLALDIQRNDPKFKLRAIVRLTTWRVRLDDFSIRNLGKGM